MFLVVLFNIHGYELRQFLKKERNVIYVELSQDDFVKCTQHNNGSTYFRSTSRGTDSVDVKYQL